MSYLSILAYRCRRELRHVAYALVLFLITIAIAQVANAKSFNYETTYWFNKVNVECVHEKGTCDVFVNDTYKDTYPYKMSGNKAIIWNEELTVTIDLNSGDFEYETK